MRGRPTRFSGIISPNKKLCFLVAFAIHFLSSMGLVAKALSNRQILGSVLRRSSCASFTSLSCPVGESRISSSRVTKSTIFSSNPSHQQLHQFLPTGSSRARRTFTRTAMASSPIPSGAEIASSLSPQKRQHGQNVELAMEALAKADAVCFDVDSTVIAEEGIDVLADFLGHGEAVAALTLKAMEGAQKFQDALKARLDLMQPAKHDIERCLKELPLHLSPGVDELIQALTKRGTNVYLVSGGFRIMIEPVAEKLNIPKTRIVANTILFDDQTGHYTGFDATEPTSADMGKPKALQMIKEAGKYNTMIMVGDGATDLQAKPPADAMIGFGGVVVRPAVEKGADWFVMDFKDMITIVNTYKQQ